MSYRILFMLGLILALGLPACKGKAVRQTFDDGKTGSLTVDVSGFRNLHGQIVVSLFDRSSKRAFPFNYMKSRARFILPASLDKEISITIPNLPHGEYAVSVFHDENENGKIDTTIPRKEILFFVPKWETEGYGYSNFHRGRLTFPDFKDSVVVLNSESKKIKVEPYYLYARYGVFVMFGPMVLLSLLFA